MPAVEAVLALPDPVRSRRAFDRAATSFAGACFIHDEARRRLLDRLGELRVGQGVLVDLGSALGKGAEALADRYPDNRVVAVDQSLAMLKCCRADGSFGRLAAVAEHLPFPDRSVDMLFANLLLPWALPESVFAEARRVLTAHGLFVFSTFGPDTLGEIRRAWSSVDDAIHVHAFWDVQTLGDLAVRAGLEEPVLDVDRIDVSYADIGGLVTDLRACGGTNTAPARRRSLTGPRRWQRFTSALCSAQRHDRLNVTIELILGQAFGSRRGKAESGGDVVIPIDQLRRTL